MLIKVSNHIISPTVAVVGTVGSAGVSHLCFQFDKGWDNLFRRVSFFPIAGGEPITLLLDNECSVPVPDELMMKSGEFDYVVSGLRDEKVLISLVGKVKVLPTLMPMSTNSVPTPSEIAQILAMMEAAKLAAENAEDSAFSAAETAETLTQAFHELLASLPSDVELSVIADQIKAAQTAVESAKQVASEIAATVETALADVPSRDEFNALATTVSANTANAAATASAIAALQAALADFPINEDFADVIALAQSAYERSQTASNLIESINVAISNLQNSIAGLATTAQLNSVSSVAQSAQNSANQANAAIAELQSNPIAGRTTLTGTYVGNGAAFQAIDVGRAWIGGIIFPFSTQGHIDLNNRDEFFLSGPEGLRSNNATLITTHTTGFNVVTRASYNLNRAGTTYRYIAF